MLDIGLSILIIISVITAVLCFFAENPQYQLIGIIPTIIAMAGLVTVCEIKAKREKETQHTKTVIGNYGNPYLIDVDTLNVKIIAVISDNEVTRSSELMLHGKDFTDDELSITTNSLVKDLVVNMLNEREHELDSIDALYDIEVTDPRDCDIKRDADGKLYKICQLNVE